jgi:hypothetical protein
MKKSFGLMFFFLLAHCSCNSITSQKPEQQNNNSTELVETESTNKKDENSKVEERLKRPFENSLVSLGRFCDGVYGATLESLIYQKVFGNIEPMETIALKRVTIFPQNVEKLRSYSEINPLTIDKFIENNKTTEKLRKDGYDVLHSIQVVDKKFSDETLLITLNRKSKDIKYLAGLSRIGYNEDFTQSLTYVEFYNLNKILQKKYVLITWNSVQNEIKDTKWFSAE